VPQRAWAAAENAALTSDRVGNASPRKLQALSRHPDRSAVSLPAPPTTPEGAQSVTFAPFANLVTWDPEFATPCTGQYNLTIQREIARDWIAEAGYVASFSRHQFFSRNLNPAAYQPVVAGINRQIFFCEKGLPPSEFLTIFRPGDRACPAFPSGFEDSDEPYIPSHAYLVPVPRLVERLNVLGGDHQ
jgi:hypothetical protein